MKIHELVNEDHGFGYYVTKNGKKTWVPTKEKLKKKVNKLKKDCEDSIKVEKDRD